MMTNTNVQTRPSPRAADAIGATASKPTSAATLKKIMSQRRNTFRSLCRSWAIIVSAIIPSLCWRLPSRLGCDPQITPT